VDRLRIEGHARNVFSRAPIANGRWRNSRRRRSFELALDFVEVAGNGIVAGGPAGSG
jgi:hypothetical protein